MIQVTVPNFFYFNEISKMRVLGPKNCCFLLFFTTMVKIYVFLALAPSARKNSTSRHRKKSWPRPWMLAEAGTYPSCQFKSWTRVWNVSDTIVSSLNRVKWNRINTKDSCPIRWEFGTYSCQIKTRIRNGSETDYTRFNTLIGLSTDSHCKWM